MRVWLFQLWYLLLLLFFSCTIYPSLFINPAFFRNCWVCLPLPFLNWNVCENLCLGAKNLFWVFVQQVDNLKWCRKYEIQSTLWVGKSTMILWFQVRLHSYLCECFWNDLHRDKVKLIHETDTQSLKKIILLSAFLYK